MAFHAGVLLYLAEKDYLERISQISSVSGGSLLVGLIYRNSYYKWPSSESYKHHIYDGIREELCTKSLQGKMILSLLNPINWKYVLSRANIFAQVLEREWGISCSVSDIEEFPVWSINGTTAENGKRFRFKHNTVGDYSIGYSDSNKFPLCQALAVSAALPGGIGPLVIHSEEYSWRKRRHWNDPSDSEQIVEPEFRKLHIYDGGVYDNLGSEPLFDPGRGSPKYDDLVLFVSDAGAPLKQGFSNSKANPFRLKRILDISMEQARALRVRSLMTYLRENPGAGAYMMIGQDPREVLGDFHHKGAWQSEAEIRSSAEYSTNLRKMKIGDFDMISRHGYELIRAADMCKTQWRL